MKQILACTIAIIAIFLLLISGKFINNRKANGIKSAKQFVCIPCGNDCDSVTYSEPGTCSHCHMQLVEKPVVMFKKIEPEQLCSFLQSKGENNVLLLDVRTPAEFNGTAEDKFGRLKNAINIPIQDLEARMSELEKYKDKEIVVYCSHSHRSPRASYLLNQKGFTKVTNMQGGMSVWKDRVKDDACSKIIFIEQ